MMILGLTGGIACGKSGISAVLRELGAAIVDGDEITRRLTAPDGAALPVIRGLFGDAVFRPDGTLDRRKLGALVFGDPEAMARYNAGIRPMILERIDAEVEAARDSGAEVCVLDMPLLYEAGLDRRCDRVWCAWVPEEVQIRRLRVRDGLDREAALQRIASQLPTDEKAARADVVINTDRPICETQALVREAYDRERRQMDDGASGPKKGGGLP